MINNKDINISEKPIAEEKAQASQEPPKQETPQQEAPAAGRASAAGSPTGLLKEVIAKQAIEEEASGSSSFTLRKILGGINSDRPDYTPTDMARYPHRVFCHHLHIQPIQYPERYHRVGQTTERTARHQIQSAVYKQSDNREES